MTHRRISSKASLTAHHGDSRSTAHESPSRLALWARPLALICVLAAASVATALLGLPDTQTLRVRIAAAGPAAPVVFVLLYALVTLLPLPKNVFAALAGVLFGLLLGIVVVLLAALLGAATAFGVSRALGREAVERLTGARVARVDALLSRRGLLAVIAVRLVPVLPFTAINYAAGLTSVRTRDYALGTAVGIVPGTVAFVAVGAFGTTPGSWPFLLSITALALFTGGGLFVAGRRRRRRKRAAASSNAPAGAAPESPRYDGHKVDLAPRATSYYSAHQTPRASSQPGKVVLKMDPALTTRRNLARGTGSRSAGLLGIAGTLACTVVMVLPVIGLLGAGAGAGMAGMSDRKGPAQGGLTGFLLESGPTILLISVALVTLGLALRRPWTAAPSLAAGAVLYWGMYEQASYLVMYLTIALGFAAWVALYRGTRKWAR